MLAELSPSIRLSRVEVLFLTFPTAALTFQAVIISKVLEINSGSIGLQQARAKGCKRAHDTDCTREPRSRDLHSIVHNRIIIRLWWRILPHSPTAAKFCSIGLKNRLLDASSFSPGRARSARRPC